MRNRTVEEMVSIPVVLSKKVDNVLYNLMVRTTTDQVFEGKYTLTEALVTIRRAIDSKASDAEFHELVHKLEKFFNCTEEDVATLRDIHYYIQSSKQADAELHKILKQDVEPAIQLLGEKNEKLTEIVADLKKKFDQILVNDYVTQEEFNTELKNYVTKEVYVQNNQTIMNAVQQLQTDVKNCITEEMLAEELRTIETQIKETVKNSMVTSEGSEAPPDLVDGGYWLQITN